VPLSKLQFKPGINREGTNYSNSGGWFDCDKIRFREGFPENIGGWVKLTDSAFLGIARSIHPWSALDGNQLYGMGTHLKYYIVEGGATIDITPIRRTVTLGVDPITTDAAGSAVLIITDTNHGAAKEDFVTLSGATGPIDDIPVSEINVEHQITELVDANTYQITVTTTATAGSVSGGGAAVVAEYQINTGLNTTIIGLGWGADPWGAGGWGDAAITTTVGTKLRLWSEDNFGEDLIICPRDGSIYLFDTSVGISSTNRADEISGIAGQVDAPTVAREVMVSNNDRHVIAFGTNDVGSAVQDLLLIRWADQEDNLNWEQLTTTTAGTLRLNTGSEIITAREVRDEILVWTDASLHSMRFLGPPFTFGQRLVAPNTSLVGPNAVIAFDDFTAWMGVDQFYIYSGRVAPLHCTVEDFVFKRLNRGQLQKVYAGTNQNEAEIIWLYPSTASEEVDSYVIYNYEQNIWYYGTIVRTAWQDRYFEETPIAAGDDGFVYIHENGCDDGSTTPATAINAFVESSDFEIGEGYHFSFIRRLLPDITFDGSVADMPQATVTITPREFLGTTYDTGDASAITRSATVPVEQFNDQFHIRLRGREIKYRVESNQLGVFWRQGIPRLDIRPDGRR